MYFSTGTKSHMLISGDLSSWGIGSLWPIHLSGMLLTNIQILVCLRNTMLTNIQILDCLRITIPTKKKICVAIACTSNKNYLISFIFYQLSKL